MDKIIEIINLWDPIGVFPMAPKDEYEIECKEIYCFFEKTIRRYKKQKFCKKINDIFSKFWEQMFITAMFKKLLIFHEKF